MPASRPTAGCVVAVHGGLPDWGTGPSGKGQAVQDRLSRPRFAAAGARLGRRAAGGAHRLRSAAGLVAAAGPARQPSIEYGEFVAPGDRFESQRPGYEVVQRQLDAPRFELPMFASQVSSDGRTLVLNTGQHKVRPPATPSRCKELPPSISGYDLSGVLATWQSDDGSESWSGWLPHLDLAVARALTAGSVDHDRLWQLLSTPGRLTLQTKLDLWQMLRPAVQPGFEDRLRLARRASDVDVRRRPLQVKVYEIKAESTGRACAV